MGIGDILQPTHLIFIFVVALLVLGPKRLPEVGRSLGRGLRDFRDAMSGDRHDEMMTRTTEPGYATTPDSDVVLTPTSDAVVTPDSADHTLPVNDVVLTPESDAVLVSPTPNVESTTPTGGEAPHPASAECTAHASEQTASGPPATATPASTTAESGPPASATPGSTTAESGATPGSTAPASTTPASEPAGAEAPHRTSAESTTAAGEPAERVG